ncbi:MAG: alpha/beta hydrolase [Pseudomonadales bacterium]|nr:alpha/beta hydrolase [Pseudomonadales bacterium]
MSRFSFALQPFAHSANGPSAEAKAYFDFYDLNITSVNTLNIQHQFGAVVVDDFSIACHLYSHPSFSHSAIISHGYMDHSGLYQHLIRHLLSLGYNVLIYDLPGHGLSSGDQAGIDSFARYQQVLHDLLAQLADELPKPWTIIGQSMGGAISADFVLHQQRFDIARLVLLAPLLVPKHWQQIQRKLVAMQFLVNEVPRKFNNSSSDQQFLQFLQQDPLQTRVVKTNWVQALNAWQSHIQASYRSDIPCLLIQGEQDNTIDWQLSVPFYQQKFGRSETLMLPEANHHLVCEAEAIRKQIFTRLDKFVNGGCA